jgi:hypothetical protein
MGLNTRGFQFGGTVGDKFSFYTSGYENQAVFPSIIIKTMLIADGLCTRPEL